MSYFFIDQNLEIGKEVVLAGDEAKHVLLSRRMKKGERFNLQGADEKRYKIEIKEINRNSLKLAVLEEIAVPPEPQIQITLFQAFVNEKALDFILQKGTELGAYKIALFNSANVANKLSAEQFNKKQERWNKILIEAAKQCDRVRPPKLEFIDDVQKELTSYQKVILLDPAGNKFKDISIQGYKDLVIIIGPEGGFALEEVDRFKALPNCIPISLGPILLRAETAAIAGLAVIQNL